MMEPRYLGGDYGRRNPTWHAEDSSWKANKIIRMLRKNRLAPQSICEVGCGAGEVLRQVQLACEPTCELWGYEIAPEAYALCREKANPRLHFRLGDVMQEGDAFFDLLLLIDVIEHVPDYLGFLRAARVKAHHKILHIPLDLSVQSILRAEPLLRARADVGHLHYFTAETALETLRDCGYDVRDVVYTAGAIELPLKSWKARVAKLPRSLLFRLHAAWAARLLGGCSLLVLAR